MQAILLAVHLVIALFLIGLIMLQKSEGGALGIGGSQSGGGLFSSRGVGSAMTRITAFLVAAFFATSITLTLVDNRSVNSVVDQAAGQTAPAGATAPAEPGAPADAGGSVLPNLDQKPAVPTNQ